MDHHHSMRVMVDIVGGSTGHHDSDGRRKRKKKAISGGRRIVVGMKLTASGREVLTWAIAKLAHPGDHVVALHVSRHPGSGRDDSEQLATSLQTVLSIYEDLCNLKQIKLQLEIVDGTKVRKALVEAARTYEAYKLVLGTTKQHAAGWSASLGKYFLKRLSTTCSLVIVDHGMVIFDKKGTRTGPPDSSVMKVLCRSMRSFGRSKNVAVVGCLDDDGTMSSFSSPTTATEAKEAGEECDDRTSVNDFESASCSGSTGSTGLNDNTIGLGSPMSVLPSSRIDCTLSSFEAFRMSYSKRRLEGSISRRSKSLRAEKQFLRMLRSCEDGDEDNSIEELDPYPTEACNSDDNESWCWTSVYGDDIVCATVPSPPRETKPPIEKGWPLMHRSMSRDNFNISSGQKLDRSMSVVNWAMHLPHRRSNEMSHGLATVDARNYVKRAFVNQELRKGDEANLHTQQGHEEFSQSKVRLSFSLPHVTVRSEEKFEASRIASLICQIDHMCRDHPRVYTFEELDAATSSFSQRNLVGIGGGSHVYRGKTHDGKLVAVKLLNHSRPQAESELLTDIEINSSLKHRHIVALLGYCVDSTHLILVYDFLMQGNLDDHLHGGTEAPVVVWDVRQKVAVGIARALDYLHDGCPRPVIHRDVKASNILLSASFDPQLSDFGLAKWAPLDLPFIRCNDVVGTFGYLAPEYFMYGRVNEKTDVYSFGVVLLELITGRQPIDTTRPKGEENLVLWARPLLDKKSVETLVDPRLDGRYDTNQLTSMMLAAALCVRHSAHRRPHMSRVLKILSGEGESLGYWPRQELASKSTDMDENAGNKLDGAADYGDTDIRTHLALAMLGVNGDVDTESSFHDQSGTLEPHSNAYIEEYLEGRCS